MPLERSMKFLLIGINAKYIHTNPAIRSLKAYAGECYKENIEIAEYTINQYTDEILADIFKRKPDAIGFSCYIWNWNHVRALLPEIHKILPQTDIWLGGPEVSFHAGRLLSEYDCVKGIMLGEGEETFKGLIKCYTSEEREAIHQIKGLQLRSGFTGEQKLLDLNDIPFFYADPAEYENRIIYYESSRGCPYRCSYCLSSIDKSVRFRSIENVRKELQYFLDNNVPQVKFIDRTFNCNHEHAMAIWKYIYEHDNSVTNFHFEISADILREDELELLSKFRPGLAQLEIGVQSTNADAIKAVNRVMNISRLREIVDSINKGHNIHEHLDLIAGLPFENLDSFKRSFNDVYAMHPEQLQLGFLKVLKGSEMEERAAEYGLIYMDNPPYEVLRTKWISYEDILKLKRIEEMVEMYYNSQQFAHTMQFLLRGFNSPYEMYEALALFYEKNGFFKTAPQRSYRYRVLYDFARIYFPNQEELLAELITYDMYLRENLKSRPDFLAPKFTEEQKAFSKAFYENEEKTYGLLPEYKGFDAKALAKMTHLEHFTYSVWEKEPVRTDAYVLFNYRNHNPLNMDAKTVVV